MHGAPLGPNIAALGEHDLIQRPAGRQLEAVYRRVVSVAVQGKVPWLEFERLGDAPDIPAGQDHFGVVAAGFLPAAEPE